MDLFTYISLLFFYGGRVTSTKKEVEGFPHLEKAMQLRRVLTNGQKQEEVPNFKLSLVLMSVLVLGLLAYMFLILLPVMIQIPTNVFILIWGFGAVTAKMVLFFFVDTSLDRILTVNHHALLSDGFDEEEIRADPRFYLILWLDEQENECELGPLRGCCSEEVTDCSREVVDRWLAEYPLGTLS